jgi:hypothetical protein
MADPYFKLRQEVMSFGIALSRESRTMSYLTGRRFRCVV